MASDKTNRSLKLAAPLSFLIYLLPVPNIALNGHTWGAALWWMASHESGGQANVAILALATTAHIVSYLLWLGFLVAPVGWKILFAPMGFAVSIGATIQLHQCTTQAWWPDWVLSAPEEPERVNWSSICSMPNAYLISDPDAAGAAFRIHLTKEARSATARASDCGIVTRDEVKEARNSGQTVVFDGYMWDSYGCAFTEPSASWRGITHSGQRFPILPSISMHDLGNRWESPSVVVWLTRRGLAGRYPVKVSWHLPEDVEISGEMPPERDLAWWSLSPDARFIAFSVTNRLFRETARDFVVVYEAATGREVFRKYTPGLSQTEVQFVGQDRFVYTDVLNDVPVVVVYRIPLD